ncbi:hypothetical protein H4219_003468 [Mycoemilia scoparia]|uniref:K Homology domain-containing protein n=1 Tax=Mycoemilia scoparia TaxID=417184 RepID=A0A9W7ZVE5_9FUNG|nr:hypothetical protein H4219_003468 [Mycoemilia scoparia]
MSDDYNAVPPPDSMKSNSAVNFNDALSKARAIAAKLGAQTGGVTVPPKTEPTTDTTGRQGVKRSLEENAHEEKKRFDSQDSYGGDGYQRDSKRHTGDSGRYRHGVGHDSRPYGSPSHGYGDQNQDKVEMRIPASLVGLFIGRSGEHLKQLQRTYSVRIQVIQDVPPSEPDRPVTIEGNAGDVESAKQAVLEFVSSNMSNQREPSRGSSSGGGGGGGMGGGSGYQSHHGSTTALSSAGEAYEKLSMQIPNSKVGLIIGRRGDNIRILQTMSGAKINITPDHSYDPNSPNRPVDIVGTRETVQKAEALIKEVIDTETFPPKSTEQYQANTGYGGPRPPQQYGGQQRSGGQTETMEIPQTAVGFIIGRGGETIRQIKAESRCSIHINQDLPPGEPRVVNITGAPEGIAHAKGMIEAKLSEASHNSNSVGGGGGGGGRGGYGGSRGYNQGSGYGTPRSGAGPTSPMGSAQGGYTGTPGGSYDPYQAAYGAYAQQSYGYPYPGQGQNPTDPNSAASTEQAWAAYYAQMGYPGYSAATTTAAAGQAPAATGTQEAGQGAKVDKNDADPKPADISDKNQDSTNGGGAATTGAQQQSSGQWTNKQAAEYYAYYATTNPEYAQYAQYYQQLAATDPDGVVSTGGGQEASSSSSTGADAQQASTESADKPAKKEEN